MKQTIVYDPEELEIIQVNVCSSISTFDDVAIKHRRSLSEGLAKRIDQELNRFLPKMFYEVEPIIIKGAGASVRIKVLDISIKDKVDKAIIAFKGSHNYLKTKFIVSSKVSGK